MEDEREALIRQMMALDRRLFDYLLVARVPAWAEVELTMPQLKVLFLVAGLEPLPAGHAARALGMTLSTATGVVDRLVAQGLVRRKESSTDRRIVLLTATDAGKELLDKLLSAGLVHFREILDRMTLQQLRIVAQAIDILYEAATQLPGHDQACLDRALQEHPATVASVGTSE